MNYTKLNKSQLEKEFKLVKESWLSAKEKNLNLDMSRGKPEIRQLNLSLDMQTCLKEPQDFKTKDGFDTRNYGLPLGIPELRNLFADVLGVDPTQIIVGGNSSLKLIYNILADAMLLGLPESDRPWMHYAKIKFLCPCPGYDRHFSMCEHLGIEMIPVPMQKDGPDMDLVERLVKSDDSIKGVFCVPKYSNPTGITFSNETVQRFASLKPKAKDFRIFWDNAYLVHNFYDTPDQLLNIHSEAKKSGNENIVFEFFSTSKITLAGSGVSCVAASPSNINWYSGCLNNECISYDKVNQLRHFHYIKSAENLHTIMKQHAKILVPKFKTIQDTFKNGFADTGFATWSNPNGGYFVNLELLEGTAKRTWELASQIGVTLTPAGATFPYKIDPKDSNLRIAPSNVDPDLVAPIAEYIIICAKLAALEKLLGIHS